MQAEKRKLEIKCDNLEIEYQQLQMVPEEDHEELLSDNRAAHYQTMKKDMQKLIDFK